MLCANVATAKFINKHNLNGLLRIHEGPGEEKLESLRTFWQSWGWSFVVESRQVRQTTRR